MNTVNPEATRRREDARNRTTGEFGDHKREEPEMTLEADDEPGWTWGAINNAYEMPWSRLPEAEARIKRANRRLEKAGIEERFTYEVEEFTHYERENPIGVRAARVTLSAPQIKMAGWSFVSAHEQTADGHIVNYGPAKIDQMRCDHCGHNRRRGKVYTVAGPEGETMVVGSNCLAAFLGIRPEGLWTLAFDLDGEDPAEREEKWTRASGDVLVPALDLIGAGLAASDDGRNFVPRSRAGFENPATSDKVAAQLRQMVEAGRVAERRARAEEILRWVNEQSDGDSDFIDNLRSVLAGEERVVGQKHFGIGVAAITAHTRAQEREVEKREERAGWEKGHLGKPKDKLTDRPMTVVAAKVFPGFRDGKTTRVTLRDTETNKQVVWWATGDRGDIIDLVGRPVTVSATVKGHDEYDGLDQTIITRGRIYHTSDTDGDT